MKIGTPITAAFVNVYAFGFQMPFRLFLVSDGRTKSQGL